MFPSRFPFHLVLLRVRKTWLIYAGLIDGCRFADRIVKRFFLALEENSVCVGLAGSERANKVIELYRGLSDADISSTLRNLCTMFSEINPAADVDLLRLAVHVQYSVSAGQATEAYIQNALPTAINRSAAARQLSGQQKVGLVFWVVYGGLFPRKLSPLFPKYLSFCNDSDVLEEQDIKSWVALPGFDTLATLPGGGAAQFSVAQLADVKGSEGMVNFLAYLDLEEDEEEEDDEDDEDDE
jgi:hypothetical protein